LANVEVEFGNYICAFAQFLIITFNVTMARKSAIMPPYLSKGDLVGIVCPAGFMPVDKVSECVRVLFEVWGFEEGKLIFKDLSLGSVLAVA